MAKPGNPSERDGHCLGGLQSCRGHAWDHQSAQGTQEAPSQPRLQSFSQEEETAIYGATESRFKDFLFAAIHTGLRPFCELATITADDVSETDRGMMWRVYSSKTKKTRKIPVRPEVAELTRRLIKTAPAGSGTPLLRNTQGRPWKRMNGVVRFIAVKKKLGWDKDPVKQKFSCYTCRHTYAHRMLSGYWTSGVGCSIETLAELIGDTPKVAFDHYGREWGQHYQEPLWAAIGAGNDKNPREKPADRIAGGIQPSISPASHSKKKRAVAKDAKRSSRKHRK